MFTGIVEDLGRIRVMAGSKLTIETVLDDIKIGDSVAVNGICLTATNIECTNGSLLSFDFSPETAERTSLKGLNPGSEVNLERALKVGDRLGGHFLSGHIEEAGTVRSISPQGEFVLITFSATKRITRYVVPKGSIGVDGISLTVVDVKPGTFTVSVIPHTVRNTNLHTKNPGDPVNLEPDMLAKYVEMMVAREESGGVTRELLKENGFM